MSGDYWIDDGDLPPIDPTPFAGAGDTCREQIIIGGLSYVCNRDVHLTERSRCMYLETDEDPAYVVAAWPGNHAPTLEDL